MAIAVRGQSNIVTTAVTDTSMLIPYPASGVWEGDKLVVFVANRGGTGVTGMTMTGWTLEDSQNVTTNCGQYCFTRTANDEPTSGWTVSWTGGTNAVADLFVLSGARGSKNIIAKGTTPATNTSHTMPTATTTLDNCLIFRVLAAAFGGTATPDAATTEVTDHRTNTGGTSMTQEIATETLATAGATGTRTVTSSSAAVAAEMTVAIAPALIHYVNAATGNDSRTIAQAQNPATPWLTLNHAFRTIAAAGDHIEVAAGNYAGDMAIAMGGVVAGTALNPVVVQGSTAFDTWITGTDATWRITGCHYWIFRYLNTDGQYHTGLSVGDQEDLVILRGDGWVFERAEIRNSPHYRVDRGDGYVTSCFHAMLGPGGSGSLTGGATAGISRFWIVQDCWMHNNEGMNWTTTPFPSTGDAVNQDHCLYITDCRDGTVRRNILTDTINGRGVKVGMSTDNSPTKLPQRITITQNTFVRNWGPGASGPSYSASDIAWTYNIFVGPTRDDPAYSAGSGDNPFIYTSNLTASGTGNTVTNNYGWMSSSLVNKFASQGFAGLTESSNTYADPQLDNFFVPQLAALFSGGVYTHGHLKGLASRAAWLGPPAVFRTTSRFRRVRRR